MPRCIGRLAGWRLGSIAVVSKLATSYWSTWITPPEFVVSWYACAMLGAVAVSTNTHSVARDLEYFAQHTAAVCAITQPAFARLVRDACPALQFVVVTDHDAGEIDPQYGDVCEDIQGLHYADMLMDEALPGLERLSSRNLSVQFTSGTTSRPQGGALDSCEWSVGREGVCHPYAVAS